VFLGCSFIYGYGLHDKQTLPWMVQEKLPSLEVRNCGTPGYGTYQSLLAMEEELSRTPTDGKRIFVYAFCDFHEGRNVADPYNLRNWVRLTRHGNVEVPYCLLDVEEKLVQIRFQGYPLLPLRQHSSLISLVEDCWITVKGQTRLRQKRAVTEQLLLRMRDLASKSDAAFIVLLQSLQKEPRDHYLSFFKNHEFEFIDGAHPEQNSLKMLLLDGYHPNADMNDYWAKLVVNYLGDS
jgi:hypothetical protein